MDTNRASLKDRTITGVGWSFVESLLGQGITFLVGIVLARILSPDEYGLIGIITIFITIFNSIVDSGFSNALIRKTDCTDEDYNTMFITNMLISILLFFILFLSAPLIASFFGRNELVPLARAMAVVIIINALAITQNTILLKRIDFKTKTKASFASAIVSGAIGIFMALSGYGVWSLVGQQISYQVVNTVCLWYFNRWIPRFVFSRKSFSYMWSFGWKLLASSLIDKIWAELYQVVVGKFYSPAVLGQYSRAKEYAKLPSAHISGIVQKVTYPVLSELQDDKQRLLVAYKRIIRLTMFITAIAMICLGAISGPLIYCLIGPKWHQASTFLPLICISLSLYPLHAINLNMLKVQGRSDLFLKLEIVKKVIAVVPILLGIFVNIYWMLVGSIFTGLISFWLNSFYSGKMLGYTSIMQLKDVLPSYAYAFLIAIPIYFLKFLPFSNWIVLALQFLVAVFLFFSIGMLGKVSEYEECILIAKQYLQRARLKIKKDV